MATTRNAQIFISYKSDEAAYAQPLRETLDKLGYHVWWDAKLQTSSGWAEDIDAQLRAVPCVIVPWSKRAVASHRIRHEASAALGKRSNR